MQVGIQTYQLSSAAELIEFCQLIGAQCVEMELDAQGKDPDKVHAMTGEYEVNASELVGRLRDKGVDVADFCLHGKLPVTTEEDVRRERLGFFFGVVDKAEELSVPLIHTYPGIEKGLPQDEVWDLFAAAYRDAGTYAEPKGVRICSQAINYPLDTHANFSRLWEELGLANAGINVDFANHYIRGEDTLALIPRLGERIFMCHAKDVDTANPVWETVKLPGLGTVDTVGCVRALLELGLEVPLIIEHESPTFDNSEHFSRKAVGVAFGVGYMKAVVDALA